MLRNSPPEQVRVPKRVAHSRVWGPSGRGALSEREERWELEMEVKGRTSRVKKSRHSGNCRICPTRSVKTMALLANRKRRQLREIGDNFEVPDEAYHRAARCPSSVNPWVTALGEYVDYMNHLAPAINTFAPSCRALLTCDASKYL